VWCFRLVAIYIYIHALRDGICGCYGWNSYFSHLQITKPAVRNTYIIYSIHRLGVLSCIIKYNMYYSVYCIRCTAFRKNMLELRNNGMFGIHSNYFCLTCLILHAVWYFRRPVVQIASSDFNFSPCIIP